MPEQDPAQRSTEAMVQRLLLLRHAEVTSHRGDVPVTAQGLAAATETGRRLGKNCQGRLVILSAETRRAQQTADAIAIGARGAGAVVTEPVTAFALRSPDLYLAGTRVDMVSSAAAFADQVPGLSRAAVMSVSFFAGFLHARDRVGWWLRHPDPPGEDAPTVRRRIMAFARSLADLGTSPAQVTVALTHSPVLRACALGILGHDPGEPDWVAGLEALIHPDRLVQLSWLAGAP
jgi:broad specificity phosphatase PhoE